MKHLSRPLLVTILASLVASCAANPVRVNIQEASDPGLDCSQLQHELARAQQFKIDARKDDRFRFQDIIITNGIQSIYNINKAESNAQKRIEYLQTLAQQKRCSPATRSSANPSAPMQGMPSQPFAAPTAPAYPSSPYDLQSPF